MVGTQRGWEGGAAQAAHAADRRWSDAGGRRPDQGGTHCQGSTCQRAASFNLFVLSSVAMSIRCLCRATRGRARRRACAQRRAGGRAPGCEAVFDVGGAQLNPRTQVTAARRMPMNANRIEAARIGDPAAAAEAARVGEPLPSSSRSDPRQGGLSNRRGAPETSVHN
ncbi:hypothetical protein EVAR_97299_1 [Eumeta japonica]|uniref:Uncharacterized protein n=1 Tax=Eumeta variegata TaxID=151549 RepID=A0A4C1XI10_EUMVA|nr:hypothetical protein EVAR_97299_1 [Eumeta japonica]